MSRLPRRKTLGLLMAVSLSVALTLFTFWDGQVDVANMRSVLSHLKYEHSTLVREVLQTRYANQADYSRLVKAHDELKIQLLALDQLLSELKPAQREPLLGVLADYRVAVQDLCDHVENYKTINSAYRNSLRYLPTAANSIVALTPAENIAFVARIQEVLSQLLVHDLKNSIDAVQMELPLEELNRTVATETKELREAVSLFSRHARNILTLKPGSQQLLDHVLQSPSMTYLEEISTKFVALDADISRNHDLLLQALIVFCGMILSYLVMTYWQLRATSHELHEANSTLEERIQERTEELNATNAQLSQAQKLESIGQLAAGVAHEINSPMQFVNDNMEYLSECTQDLFTVLEAYRENLSMNGPQRPWQEREAQINSLLPESRYIYMREQVPQAIEESMEGIQRVITIVRAMKEFSHPGTSEKVSTDINQALRSTATISKNRWKYVADLEFDFDENLPDVKALPTELNQVFLNLVVNAGDAIASKLGEDSGEKGLIAIRTRTEANFVVIEVSDSGCGIPEEIRNRVYDPFFTTKDVGKGTGQGLAISHNIIVDKHGGRLDLESTPGVGTTFFVRLPAVPAPQAQQEYVDKDLTDQLIEV